MGFAAMGAVLGLISPVFAECAEGLLVLSVLSSVPSQKALFH